jgi:N utilization substance protein B
MTRREEREQAFVLIFEKMFTEDSVQEIINKASEARDIEIGDYALKAATNVVETADELDAQFESYLKRWNKNRISKVSLSILRLAVYELIKEKDIPDAAVINEAVDLTKFFSDSQSGRFVNGVLDKYAKSLSAKRPATAE